MYRYTTNVPVTLLMYLMYLLPTNVPVTNTNVPVTLLMYRYTNDVPITLLHKLQSNSINTNTCILIIAFFFKLAVEYHLSAS